MAKWQSILNVRHVIWQYIDLSAWIGICVSVMGVALPLYFREELQDLAKWCILTLAVVAFGATWFVGRLSKRLGEANGQANLKDQTARQLSTEIQSLKDSLLKQAEKRTDIAYGLHNINHEARNLLNNILSAMEKSTEYNGPNIKIEFSKFIFHLLDNTSSIFEVLTGKKCAVTIKTLDDEKSKITTLERDSGSRRERAEADVKKPSFYAKENTAFLRIIDSENNTYACDDLIEEHKAKRYKNSNPRWQDRYTACLVAPIRCRMSASKGVEDYDLFGFICVDNKWGGLATKECSDILCSIGDNLYCIFTALDEIFEPEAKKIIKEAA
jgi:hypothetical protein